MPSSHITTSRFARVLAGGMAPDAREPGMDFAERMALWFSAFDAIRLQGVHQSVRSALATAPRKPARHADAAARALDEDLQRVRSALAAAIAQHTVLDDEAAEATPAFAPYQQRHVDLQRRMDMLVAPLREHARQAAGRASPRLRQLAALDATLEAMLAQRQQALLATTAQLLQQRFKQLRSEGAADWRSAFEHHWREALAAEAGLRLEPVAGLVEALRHASDDIPS